MGAPGVVGGSSWNGRVGAPGMVGWELLEW